MTNALNDAPDDRSTPALSRARLYIAGSSSAVPRPGRANSGYLLQSHECNIAIDFGSGVLSRMREVLEPTQLDAIVISHMHADHFLDLVPLRYALRYEMQRAEPLPVYLPPGGIAAARAIGKPLKDEGDFYDGILDLREYDPQDALVIRECRVRFAKTVHYIPAYAMRIEMPGAAVGFSADTAPCAPVVDLVCGADMFLCEASLGPSGRERGERGHSNAREAAEMAREAAVGHLMLTHYSARANPIDLRAAAAAVFEGPVTVADDGLTMPLGPLS